MLITKYPEVQTLLADAERLGQAKRWNDAANVCERARRLVPDNVDVIDKLGWYQSRSKNYEDAIKIYTELTNMQPNWAKWPYMVGYQYYEQGKWREAALWFDRALKLRPEYLVVLYRSGYIQVQLEDLDKATQLFEKCVSVWRNLVGEQQVREAKHYSDACFQLGKLLLAKGMSVRAEQILCEAVRYGIADPYKHYNLGKALLKNGKASEALDQFLKSDKMQPGKDFILVYLARAYIGANDLDRAEFVLKRILPKQRKAYVWREIGNVQLRKGQLADALESLKKAVHLDRSNHNTYYLLGQVYEAFSTEAEACSAHQAYSLAIALRKEHYDLDFTQARERLDALEAQYPNVRGSLAERTSDAAQEMPTAARTMGYVKSYNRPRGFGFLSREGSGDLFFHISDVDRPGLVAVGTHVAFEEAQSHKGLCAARITILDDPTWTGGVVTTLAGSTCGQTHNGRELLATRFPATKGPIQEPALNFSPGPNPRELGAV
jgi:tetratricopeptide (TPR) repeat protein